MTTLTTATASTKPSRKGGVPNIPDTSTTRGTGSSSTPATPPNEAPPKGRSRNGRRRRVSWDSSVLLDWLESSAAGAPDPGDATAAAVSRGEATLVLSAIIFSEVLPTRSPAGVFDNFEALLAGPNVEVVTVTEEIARRAATIRDAGLSEPRRRKIKTPDAVIVATALAAADELHTTDYRLRQLSGHETAGGLLIRLPG